MNPHALIVRCPPGTAPRSLPRLAGLGMWLCDSAATGQPGRAQRATSAVFASLRLPCAARVRGPDAKLPPFAALTVVRQSLRVSARSALRARASNPVLLSASHARWARPGRMGAAEKRRLAGRARTRALRALTRRNCLTKASAASGGSFSTGPASRASQGTRSEAKGKPFEPGPGRARRLARTHVSTKQRTVTKVRNGPRAAQQQAAAQRNPSQSSFTPVRNIPV